MKHVITMVGLPGAGKTTLSKLLANEIKYAYISTGDFVRSVIADQSKQDQQLQSGGLSSAEDLIRKWVIDEIKKNGGKVVLDGFPRTPEQVDVVAPMIDAVIVIDASVEECRKRLIDRKRDDQDTNHVKIDKRVNTFLGSFHPILERIESSHIQMYRVNGNRTIGEIWLDVIGLFKKEEQK
jgi:adenylate kinase family enzyme